VVLEILDSRCILLCVDCILFTILLIDHQIMMPGRLETPIVDEDPRLL
jgi:hypothetical protein